MLYSRVDAVGWDWLGTSARTMRSSTTDSGNIVGGNCNWKLSRGRVAFIPLETTILFLLVLSSKIYIWLMRHIPPGKVETDQNTNFAHDITRCSYVNKIYIDCKVRAWVGSTSIVKIGVFDYGIRWTFFFIVAPPVKYAWYFPKRSKKKRKGQLLAKAARLPFDCTVALLINRRTSSLTPKPSPPPRQSKKKANQIRKHEERHEVSRET